MLLFTAGAGRAVEGRAVPDRVVLDFDMACSASAVIARPERETISLGFEDNIPTFFALITYKLVPAHVSSPSL